MIGINLSEQLRDPFPNLKKVDKMKQQTKLGNGPNNTSMGIYIDL
jgi:hypothetical protein